MSTWAEVQLLAPVCRFITLYGGREEGRKEGMERWRFKERNHNEERESRAELLQNGERGGAPVRF